MEGAIIARLCFDSKTIAFPIYKHTTYDDIKEHISSRFKSFPSRDVELSYAFEGHLAFLLQTDMDVQMMVLSFSSANKSYVDIAVKLSEVSPDKNGANTNDYDYVNHHLGKFSTPATKKYLSDEWKTFIMCVGQKFDGGVIEFREKLTKYAIEHGFRYKCLKNESSRVTAVCNKRVTERCLWNVHATLNRTNGFFYIQRLNNEHTCNSRICDGTSPSMRSKVVASVLGNQVRSNPLIRPVDVIKDFKRNYGMEISYYNVWKGKEMAKKDVHGDDELSYKHLEWYVNELLKTNPGSHAKLECDSDHRFVRMFISFQGPMEGFKHCRPMLALDGAHIKNKYKGHLLSATGKNGNNGTNNKDQTKEEECKEFLMAAIQR